MIQKFAFVCNCCGTYVVVERESIISDEPKYREMKYYCPACSYEMEHQLECGHPVPVFLAHDLKDFRYCPTCGEDIRISEEDCDRPKQLTAARRRASGG